jgi:hypothetical protein
MIFMSLYCLPKRSGYSFFADFLREKGWQKLRGFTRLTDVINGAKFVDGIDEETIERQRNAV